MKKALILILAVGIFGLAAFRVFSFAEEMPNLKEDAQLAGDSEHASAGGMKSKPMMGKMGMMGMMHMMKQSLIATSDGGVVVLSGRKLMKYDKDLNLVKEIELKMEAPGQEMKRIQEPMPGSSEETPLEGSTAPLEEPKQ